MRTPLGPRLLLVLVVCVGQLALACSSDGDSGQAPGGGTTSANVKTCITDADCAGGKVCYATDDPADRYCTTACKQNADCEKQQLCPSFATLDEADCRGAKSVGGKDACQIFDSSLGPKGCAGKNPKPKGPDTNVPSCTQDGDCGAGKGCYQTDDPADAYCTPLCDGNETCAFQVLCPSLEVLEESDCRQKSSDKKGVCQIFDSSLGPKGCGEAKPR